MSFKIQNVTLIWGIGQHHTYVCQHHTHMTLMIQVKITLIWPWRHRLTSYAYDLEDSYGLEAIFRHYTQRTLKLWANITLTWPWIYWSISLMWPWRYRPKSFTWPWKYSSVSHMTMKIYIYNIHGHEDRGQHHTRPWRYIYIYIYIYVNILYMLTLKI